MSSFNDYRVSRYNHFQPRENGQYIAYNAWSGAVALMTPENYELYRSIKRLIKAESPREAAEKEARLMKQLEHARFIYPADRDQFEEISFMHHMGKYGTEGLGFVIAPTMACNMACRYCFEADKKGRMSDETIAAIADCVDRKGRRLEEVSIGWYGGEPLLAMDIVEKITAEMLRLRKKHGFAYAASMITNGYLLHPENVDKLLKYGVGVVQVTVDGPARVHNVKRPLKNGRPSYATIIENLKYASEKMVISLRVNVDKSFNLDMLSEMLDELEAAGLRDKVEMYFGLLEPATTVCANIAESCHNTVEFSRAEIEYFRLLLDRGFKIEKLPSPISNFCLAQVTGGFVMDHEGELYRCFNYVGDKSKSMGNIRDEIDYLHPNFTSLFRFDPFRDEVCRECNILPICLGGCPAKRQHRLAPREEMCESWKHNLPEMLEIIARSRYRSAEASVKETP